MVRGVVLGVVHYLLFDSSTLVLGVVLGVLMLKTMSYSAEKLTLDVLSTVTSFVE